MAAPTATYILTGKLRFGNTPSGAAMRWTSSVNAARYSGRVALLGRMPGLHCQHGQETRGTERTTFQPTGEDRDVGSAGMQKLGEGEEAAAIRVGVAGKHDGEAGHKESGAGGGPRGRVELTGRTERQQLTFVVARQFARKMTVGGGRGLGGDRDGQARACGAGERY